MAPRIAFPLAVLALCLCAVAGDARGSAPPPYVLRLARRVNQQPTAPSATLSATFDGGARWRVVRGGLPEIAPVEFLSPTEAWQAGGPFGFALFHSVDGGRMWARARLPAPVREHGAKG